MSRPGTLPCFSSSLSNLPTHSTATSGGRRTCRTSGARLPDDTTCHEMMNTTQLLPLHTRHCRRQTKAQPNPNQGTGPHPPLVSSASCAWSEVLLASSALPCSCRPTTACWMSPTTRAACAEAAARAASAGSWRMAASARCRSDRWTVGVGGRGATGVGVAVATGSAMGGVEGAPATPGV